jgi:Pregnancy-associated plasma protein-A/Secretion system C-terminal sorting domain
MKKLILAIISIGSLYSASAQRSCATMDVLAKDLLQNPTLQQVIDAQEAHTAQYVSQFDNHKSRSSINIPVVVHILHAGEAVGNGANISDAQVLSQIDAMNEDFNKLNGDSLKSNHAFYSNTANAQIHFCLATVSPTGTVTTGIKRYNMQVNSVSDFDMDNTIKPQTIWNKEKYLNIWVCNITAQSSILGYATFPSTGSNSTDGVVILTTAFGYVGNVTAPYNNGRTTVHEVGHWLNLRHIWGDANCGSDQVADTKPASAANYGCPTFPYHTYNSCGGDGNGEMFMNYMDYVDDNCMVMFTNGQKARMWATLTGSRLGLQSSNGCGGVASGVRDLSDNKNIYIMPNPAHDVFEIHIDDDHTFYSVNILNANGQVVKQIKNKLAFNGIISADISGFIPGFYTVQLNDGVKASYLKLVVN